jgi:hypothetical protein
MNDLGDMIHDNVCVLEANNGARHAEQHEFATKQHEMMESMMTQQHESQKMMESMQAQLAELSQSRTNPQTESVTTLAVDTNTNSRAEQHQETKMDTEAKVADASNLHTRSTPAIRETKAAAEAAVLDFKGSKRSKPATPGPRTPCRQASSSSVSHTTGVGGKRRRETFGTPIPSPRERAATPGSKAAAQKAAAKKTPAAKKTRIGSARSTRK